MHEIPGYSQYFFKDGAVFKHETQLPVHIQNYKQSLVVKVKTDCGKWKNVAVNTLAKLAGQILKLPKDAKKIPFTNQAYITKSGKVYVYDSFTRPTGFIVKECCAATGYPTVSIHYKGKLRKIEVHQLLAVTFIMEDYIEKGLCVLHKDDDKTNYCLNNISIGTYTKNNRDAYKTGINKGNGLKK